MTNKNKVLEQVNLLEYFDDNEAKALFETTEANEWLIPLIASVVNYGEELAAFLFNRCCKDTVKLSMTIVSANADDPSEMIVEDISLNDNAGNYRGLPEYLNIVLLGPSYKVDDHIEISQAKAIELNAVAIVYKKLFVDPSKNGLYNVSGEFGFDLYAERTSDGIKLSVDYEAEGYPLLRVILDTSLMSDKSDLDMDSTYCVKLIKDICPTVLVGRKVKVVKQTTSTSDDKS